MQAFDSPLDEPVVNAVQELAESRGVTMAPGGQGVFSTQLNLVGRATPGGRNDAESPPPSSASNSATPLWIASRGLASISGTCL